MKKEKKKKRSIVKTLLIAIIILGVIGALFGKDDEKEKSSSESKEEHGVTNVDVKKSDNELYGSIDDFSYDISENKIILNKYTGKSDILEIKASYTIDGMEYVTDLSDFQVGIGNSDVETLIFDDGIKEVKDSIFNSSDVKKVYFPKSMTIVYDKTLSYLHPKDGEKIKIYYEGTQDEWSNIFTEYKRKNIADTELGEEMGTAAADKLNEMIGAGYDSSEFEYFFSSSSDDLK